MSKVRFVHAADLHLDTPFKGLSKWNSDLSKKLKDATFRSFRNIIDICLNRNVDFLIISGDIFDSENKSLAAQLRFVSDLETLSGKGIPVYFVCGNHDPLKSWLDVTGLPENVYRFDSSGIQYHTFKKEGESLADIHGISFGEKSVKRNLAADYKLASVRAPISIAVLHGTIGPPGPHENYAPFSRDDVAKSGFDYWALGHIHRNNIFSPSNPAIVYPGNSQGRDFGETGGKGCYLVEISKGHDPAIEFIPTQVIRFENLGIDMSAVSKIENLQGKINEELEKMENYKEDVSYILRIILYGRTGLHKSINDKAETDTLAELFNEGQLNQPYFRWIDQIYVRTRPDIDIDKVKSGTGFSAEILKKIDSYLKDDKKLEDLIKEAGEDFSNAQAKKEIVEITEDDRREMLDHAKMILLDRLIREE